MGENLTSNKMELPALMPLDSFQVFQCWFFAIEFNETIQFDSILQLFSWLNIENQWKAFSGKLAWFY